MLVVFADVRPDEAIAVNRLALSEFAESTLSKRVNVTWGLSQSLPIGRTSPGRPCRNAVTPQSDS